MADQTTGDKYPYRELGFSPAKGDSLTAEFNPDSGVMYMSMVTDLDDETGCYGTSNGIEISASDMPRLLEYFNQVIKHVHAHYGVSPAVNTFGQDEEMME